MTLTLTRPKTIADALVLGGAPRVHLLPTQVDIERKARGFRRKLLTGLVAVVVLVIAVVAFVSIGLAGAISTQQAAQSNGQLLASQLAKYGAVTSVQGQVNEIQAAQPVATSGEILWEPFIAKVQATLPADTFLTAISAKVDTATETPSNNPLIASHVATLTLTAEGPQASLSAWLATLPSLKGLVGSTPGEVAVLGTAGMYSANVNLLLDKSTLSTRFTKVAK